MKELTFQEFCDKTVSNLGVNLKTDSTKIEERFRSIADNIVREFKTKTKRLGSMKLDYITDAFNKYSSEELGNVLHEKTEDDDIPDELFNYLSSGLYKMKYEDMEVSQKNIIAVFAIYIILQI